MRSTLGQSFRISIVFIILSLSGIALIKYLNLELNPNSRSSSVAINFNWPGTEPRVIEQEVTSKLEALFAQVKGIREISSTSGNENGTILLSLDKKGDRDAIRFEVSSLIRQAWPGMPAAATYPVIRLNQPGQERQRPLLTYNLNAPASASIVQKYADDHIKPFLSQIKGIDRVEVFGSSPPEWIIEYDEDETAACGITTEEIRQAVARTINKEHIGTGRDPCVPVILRTNLSESFDIHGTVVKKQGDRILHLDDIATLKHEESKPQNIYRINGLNTITILVYAGPDENNLVVADNTKNVVKTLAKSLPAGYELLLSDDSTEFIYNELSNIVIRSVFTLLILTVFVILVTRRWKHALLLLIMLAGNLSIAVIFYYLLKIEVHLYALAGITVSLGLMTDNVIIMSDHIRTRGNRKAFLAILAGTFATISALVVIFFLKEEIKANLVDFALVIIINQSVSIVTALFVVPALMEKLRLGKENSGNHGSLKRNRRTVRFTGNYFRLINFLQRRKAIVIILLLLGFGLPVYLLPEKADEGKWYSTFYNATIGAEWYKGNVRPWLDKITGGALRLFTEKVYDGSYFRTPEETSLFITASFPRGSTLKQADDIISGMESYLRDLNGIKLFQSSVSARNASVTVYFKNEALQSSFPLVLKGDVISKAIELGGADWSVFGFGDGFSNNVYEGAGTYSVRIRGYNYDRLLSLGEKLKDSLSGNPRISQVYILSERTWYKPDNTEFIAKVSGEKADIAEMGMSGLYRSLNEWSLVKPVFAAIVTERGVENVRLRPESLPETDLWSLVRRPFRNDSDFYKLYDFSEIGKETTSPVISKKDQQYQVYLQFDYIGSDKFARRYINEKVENFIPVVPVGYSVVSDTGGFFWWGQEDKKQYWLLLLIVIMIFFTCAVLFESLLQPLAVILIIPVGYIGIFLTFYLFGLNFDQGGFAALVMLSGLTVNAAIYILNDYNVLRRQYKGRNTDSIALYLKAFNYKIIPILLTIVSTVLGFVPFLIGEKQPFWFALAAGTIGGLIFSLIGIIFYLPVFLRIGDKQRNIMRHK